MEMDLPRRPLHWWSYEWLLYTIFYKWPHFFVFVLNYKVKCLRCLMLNCVIHLVFICSIPFITRTSGSVLILAQAHWALTHLHISIQKLENRKHLKAKHNMKEQPLWNVCCDTINCVIFVCSGIDELHA